MRKKAISQTDKSSLINKVISVASEYFDVPAKIIVSKTRKTKIVRIRFFCYKYIWDYNTSHLNKSITLAEVGKHFNNRDHSTIIHGLETLENEMSYDQTIINEYNLFSKFTDGVLFHHILYQQIELLMQRKYKIQKLINKLLVNEKQIDFEIRRAKQRLNNNREV
jgi:hypothetical protein